MHSTQIHTSFCVMVSTVTFELINVFLYFCHILLEFFVKFYIDASSLVKHIDRRSLKNVKTFWKALDNYHSVEINIISVDTGIQIYFCFGAFYI